MFDNEEILDGPVRETRSSDTENDDGAYIQVAVDAADLEDQGDWGPEDNLGFDVEDDRTTRRPNIDLGL
ncbi:hypothetical protein [Nocardia sp. NPDC049149]|uniref:hypothetical protein n=1 Tax=Nocardia sp. NPDC049149 TaxID=3364315 RepID=UPI00371E1B20